MRVAVLADIHGNLPALEAVLAEVEGESFDAVVVVGDTISGPWPVEVFDRLADVDARIVRGNADREVLERSERFGPLAAWSADRLGEDRLAPARAWPLTLELPLDDLGTGLVCHSTPQSDDPIYTRVTPERDLLDLFGGVHADVVLCGHTHMQYDRSLASGLRLVNAGSVGMPYEEEPGAYWAFVGPEVELRRTSYDTAATVEAIRALGAPIDERLLSQLVDPPSPEETTAYFESHRGP
jgi:predicted phosphodiesterase